jgi:F-type H+-transporting ATPase subunit gamma
MPNLKDLKNRIGSVKSTRKITKAMQMVAAAKLRRAQDAAEAARPYADKMAGGRWPRGLCRGVGNCAALLAGTRAGPRAPSGGDDR